ncbi:hypothetical protein LINPERPRIM_LOCUS10031 [Linum perenne]
MEDVITFFGTRSK